MCVSQEDESSRIEAAKNDSIALSYRYIRCAWLLLAVTVILAPATVLLDDVLTARMKENAVVFACEGEESAEVAVHDA
jgi:hypothetical protein